MLTLDELPCSLPTGVIFFGCQSCIQYCYMYQSDSVARASDSRLREPKLQTWAAVINFGQVHLPYIAPVHSVV